MIRSARALLAVSALLTSAFAGTAPASAALPPDSPGWIRQGGNGASGSAPAQEVGLTEVLFRPDQFVGASTGVKTTDKWRAWGGLVNTDGTTQLAMFQGGQNANWSAPQPATLRDPDGNDVPFLLGDTVHFGVQFQNLRQNWPAYFIVYWDGTESSQTGTSLNNGLDTSLSTHMAVSMDGVRWFDDVELALNPVDPAMTGLTGINAGMLGATQVFLNPRAGFCTDAPSSNFPFDCAISIVYTAVADTGKTSIMAAGADRYNPLGTAFRARTTPLLAPAAAGWDNFSVDLAKIRQRKAPEGSGWEMTYAGTTGSLGCQSGMICQLGVASSSNRFTWTRNNVGRAATEPALYENYLAGPVTLGPAIFVNDGTPPGHAKGFISVRNAANQSGTTWMAETAPAPTTAPTIEVSKPDNGFYNSSAVAIDLFANDDLGANPGINEALIELTVDGLPLETFASWSTSPTIVGSFYQRGVRIMAPANQVNLPEGLHTLRADVVDLDGEAATLTTQFTIDLTPPASVVNSMTSSENMFTYPFESPFSLTGKTTDALSGVESVSAVITNTLGQRVVYDSRAEGSGFNLTPIPGGYTWSFTPPPQPALMVPGTMQVSILGRDRARNIEQANGANTRGLIVI